MSWMFWLLVIATAAMVGGLIYRVSAGVRKYNLDRDVRFSAELWDAEFDLLLLRWSAVFAVLTMVWGLGEGAVRLLS